MGPIPRSLLEGRARATQRCQCDYQLMFASGWAQRTVRCNSKDHVGCHSTLAAPISSASERWVERRTLPVHDSLLLRGFFSFVPRLRTFLYQNPHSSLPTMQDKLSKYRAIPTLLTSWFAHDFCEPCANAQIPQEWILLLPRLPTVLQQDTSRHFLNHKPATIRFCLSPQFVEENRGEEDRSWPCDKCGFINTPTRAHSTGCRRTCKDTAHQAAPRDQLAFPFGALCDSLPRITAASSPCRRLMTCLSAHPGKANINIPSASEVPCSV
eukprot:scaffold53_cov381-Pavlova_lutheri.AAC.12